MAREGSLVLSARLFGEIVRKLPDDMVSVDADGSTVSLQSAFDGIYPFLDTAFAAWCLETGRDPGSCDFHDPSQSLWFPTLEEDV